MEDSCSANLTFRAHNWQNYTKLPKIAWPSPFKFRHNDMDITLADASACRHFDPDQKVQSYVLDRMAILDCFVICEGHRSSFLLATQEALQKRKWARVLKDGLKFWVTTSLKLWTKLWRSTRRNHKVSGLFSWRDFVARLFYAVQSPPLQLLRWDNWYF